MNTSSKTYTVKTYRNPRTGETVRFGVERGNQYPTSFTTPSGFKPSDLNPDGSVQIRKLNPTVRQQPPPNPGEVLGVGAGILGAASVAAPVLAPVAAVAGVGYGVYKLGETFHWW